jgi:hypothetical protein
MHLALNDSNTSRTEIDKDNFEAIIEMDFIDGAENEAGSK